MEDDFTGFQIVLLLRVSPITPLSVCTLLLSLTELRFIPYVFGTAIGLTPPSIPYAYLGAVGKDVADKGLPTGVWDIISYLLGAVATVLVSWKVYDVSESVLKKHTLNIDIEEIATSTKELLPRGTNGDAHVTTLTAELTK
eukprot:CAMPEP_0197543802 /NCGR_PEP_ID=MMETSP1318-20131121/68433_1 /TAXON_ID=552666 /ORGANISM="Partenskyella glossopodia, Strain RCC365" /LENGTH=140 /DNA_ID=CAMNT_0043103165 /DNA_START=551 /DNA_END=973 /DNA_ORIENTATION=+